VQDSIEEKFDDQDVVVLGLVRNITSYEWLVSYVSERSITYDMLYHADEVFAAYGVFQDPTYILLDRQGQIRFRSSEYYSHRISELVNLVHQLVENSNP